MNDRLVDPALFAGAHAKAVHEESAASFPGIREIQFDEKCSSIHERWKDRDPTDSRKDWPVQEAMTPLTSYSDCSLYVRAPRSRGEDGR